MSSLLLLLFAPVLIAAVVAVGLVFFPVPLWLRARRLGLEVSPLTLVAMRMRGVKQHDVVEPLMAARQADLPDVELQLLECHHLAGGDPERVVEAMLEARKSGQELAFMAAAALDLAGRDPLRAVEEAASPRREKLRLAEIALTGGDRLRVELDIELRTRLEALIGGASQDQVLEKVRAAFLEGLGAAADRRQAEGSLDRLATAVIEGQDGRAACEVLRIRARLV